GLGKGSESYPAGSAEQIIQAYYKQIMAYSAPSENNSRIFADVLSRISAVASIEDYAAIMAEFMREYGLELFLLPRVDMNPFKPDEYCTAIIGVSTFFGTNIEDMEKDPYSAETIKETVQAYLTAFGANAEDADKRSDSVTLMLLGIADNTDIDALTAEDYYKHLVPVSTEELSGIFSAFDFEKTMRESGFDVLPDTWYIMDDKQLEAINETLCDENLQALKDFAAATFVMKFGQFLPDEYSGFRSRYFGELGDITDRDAKESCCNMLADRIGEVYAKQYTDETTVAAAEKMCEEIRAAYYDLIQSADWLSEQTREQLCRKLNNLVFVIGSPEPKEITQADKALIADDLFATTLNFSKQSWADMAANIGKEYPKDLFGMPSTAVNACYNTNNTITIPLAILNPPFFDASRSDAQNLGALGSVIAHEMSHAFDSNCIDFDADGKYDPEWLPEADRLAFEEKMRLTEDYFSKYTIMEVYHVDGELTLGENFADLGGVECVLSMAKTDDEKRELLESYANIWCMLEDDSSALSGLRYDVHSPAMVRVNAVVASLDEYYELYDVTAQDGMYVAPEDRVSRW
ncbi:MAG: M13 family metallopeptidase, partial [Oscillospiraceae bacterium]